MRSAPSTRKAGSGGRRCAAAGAAVLLALGSIDVAAAQEPESPGADAAAATARDTVPEDGSFFQVAAFSGALAPLTRLSEDPETFATEISTSLAFGGALTWWSAGGLGIGVHAMRAPARLHTRATEFQGVIPNDLGDAAYSAATLDLYYRLRLPGAASILEPFFALGGGIRHLSFDPIAERDVHDSTDPVATAAGGVLARLSRELWLRLEVRDHLSTFDATPDETSRLQNDVAISVGVGVRFR